MKIILFTVLTFLLAAPAYTRIGETVEKCDARYGKPMVAENIRVYQKGAVKIEITFRAGKALEIEIENENWTKAELLKCLNEHLKTWAQGLIHKTHYLSDDGKIFAFVSGESLNILPKELYDARMAELD